jgi:hypothetical protein
MEMISVEFFVRNDLRRVAVHILVGTNFCFVCSLAKCVLCFMLVFEIFMYLSYTYIVMLFVIM